MIYFIILRYIGSFTDDKPKGKGKYFFDLGCEMRGSYAWIEKENQNQNEEDEIETVVEPRWIGEELCQAEDK